VLSDLKILNSGFIYYSLQQNSLKKFFSLKSLFGEGVFLQKNFKNKKGKKKDGIQLIISQKRLKNNIPI